MTDIIPDQEQIKAAPKPPKELRLAAEIALMKSPPAAEENTVHLEEIKLPETAKETHKLMQEILLIEPNGNRETAIKLAKLAKIRAHLVTLEDGPPPPVIGPAEFRAIMGAQSVQAIKLIEQVAPEMKQMIQKFQNEFRAGSHS